MTKLVLLVNLAATLYMTGVIWFVQVVHYPLFEMVGRGELPAYSAQHSMRTTFVVAAPMMIEALTAAILVMMAPARVSRWVLLGGLALVGVVWVSTFLLQVPQHGKLALVYDVDAIRFLVASNWLRCICWTLRSLLMLYAAAKHL